MKYRDKGPYIEQPNHKIRQGLRHMFVHLNVKSSYSVNRSTIGAADLADRCKELGFSAVGVTDYNNLAGPYILADKLASKGIRHITGVDLPLETDGRTAPISLLVASAAGWSNIVKLVSTAHLTATEAPHNGFSERAITMEELAGVADGLICLSGGIRGHLATLLCAGLKTEARLLAKRLAAMFPDRYFIEVNRHDGGAYAVEADLVGIADELAIPLVATTDAHFLGPDDHEAQDALYANYQGMTVNTPARHSMRPGQYLRPAAEMEALFADLPDAVHNTGVVAEMCRFMPIKDGNQMPVYPVGEAETEDGLVAARAREGMVRRGLAGKPAYEERLASELKLLADQKFSGYFLVVAGFIGWSRSQGIPVGPGRGSGAGSLVAYCLGITDIDPLEYGLLFERFINPARVSLPDFDIDFCQARRAEVIQHVREIYGDERVSHIGAHGKLQAKGALGTAVKALGGTSHQAFEIQSLVPMMRDEEDTDDKRVPFLLAKNQDLRNQLAALTGPLSRIGEIAVGLEGALSNISSHAAGILITPKPMSELNVALTRDGKGKIVTQADMKGVEAAGLVKFDFLGLATLDVIDFAEKSLAARGEAVDWSLIGVSDPATYRMMAKGETHGVFQFESFGMRSALREVRPTAIADLIAITSLHRPGPKQFIPQYARRKNGLEDVVNEHSSMDEILKETHGIIVYQEQVMQLVQKMAGYSLGEADILRRAMGKKDAKAMSAHRVKFVEGCGNNGISEDIATVVFDKIAKFAEYGFNKSHAAAYSVLSFRTAYLRCHHQALFTAANLHVETKVSKRGGFATDAVLSGLKVLGPDINRSGYASCDEDGAVRWGLADIKSVASGFAGNIAKERLTGGSFGSLPDFVVRMSRYGAVEKRSSEILIQLGAFEGLHANIPATLDWLEPLRAWAKDCEKIREKQRKAGEKQGEASNGATRKRQVSAKATPDYGLPAMPLIDESAHRDESAARLMKLEAESKHLGLYISGHPVTEWPELYTRPVEPVMDLVDPEYTSVEQGEDGEYRNYMPVIGVRLDGVEYGTTKKGDPMVRLEVSDLSGRTRVSAFNNRRRKTVDAIKSHLEVGGFYWIEVEVSPNSRGSGNGEPSPNYLNVDGLKRVHPDDELRRRHSRRKQRSAAGGEEVGGAAAELVSKPASRALGRPADEAASKFSVKPAANSLGGDLW